MRRHLYGWLLTGAVLSLLSLSSKPAVGETAHDEITVSTQVYLPLILRPLTTEITFGTSADAQGRPSPPQTTIAPSARRLYYNVSVEGGAGRSFRTEYYLPGGPIAPDTGTLPSNDFDSPGVICYTDPSIPNCDQPTGTLVPGTYRIRLFIDEQLVAEESATVLPSLDQPRDGTAVPRAVPATPLR